MTLRNAAVGGVRRLNPEGHRQSELANTHYIVFDMEETAFDSEAAVELVGGCAGRSSPIREKGAPRLQPAG